MTRSHRAGFASAASDASHLPSLSFPEVAFAGRSNVGKSSLLNRLVNRRNLARVSKTPGRTQQINFFVVDDRVVFADLPGYGFARVPAEVQQAWKALVEGYLSARRQLVAVCVLVDVRRGIEPDDARLLEYLAALGIQAFVAITKVDKLARGPRLQRCREIGRSLSGVPIVATSAATGEGMAEVWDRILSALGEEDAADPSRPSGARRKTEER